MSIAKLTICRFLYSNGFSRQKLQLAASQQDVLRRQQYVSDLSVYSSEMFVFVDETGADRRNTLNMCTACVVSLSGTKIYSLEGREFQQLLMAGVLDVMTVHGTSDGSTFYKFIQTHLLPHLMPFNPLMAQIHSQWLSWIIVPFIMLTVLLALSMTLVQLYTSSHRTHLTINLLKKPSPK